MPLIERKRLMSRVVVPTDVVNLVEYVETDGGSFFEAAVGLGLEGMVAKRARSEYEPGARSDSWLKIKATQSQELVVGGYTPGSGARAGSFGALLVGYRDDEGLRYAGRVGTGFDDAMLDDLRRALDGLATDDSPFRPDPEMDRLDAVTGQARRVGSMQSAGAGPAGRERDGRLPRNALRMRLFGLALPFEMFHRITVQTGKDGADHLDSRDASRVPVSLRGPTCPTASDPGPTPPRPRLRRLLELHALHAHGNLSRMHLESRYPGDVHRALRNRQVVCALQVDPEIGTVAEQLAETGHLGGDGRFSLRMSYSVCREIFRASATAVLLESAGRTSSRRISPGCTGSTESIISGSPRCPRPRPLHHPIRR